MDKYRKKEVVAEAIKFSAEKWIYERKEAFPMVETRECNGRKSSLGGFFTYEPVITTLDGDCVVKDGDYIVKSKVEIGKFYTCDPGVFEKNFERVEEKAVAYPGKLHRNVGYKNEKGGSFNNYSLEAPKEQIITWEPEEYEVRFLSQGKLILQKREGK